MASTSHRDRILATLRLAERPLDDDELSKRTGITPRQTVNQICRALATAGILRRVPGPDGKIVNTLGTETDRAAHAVMSAPAGEVLPPGSEQPAGSSSEQRAAERVMLDLLGRRLGLTLDPARLTVPSGARVEIDGADPSRSVLVECWAHQGPPKAAQKHKVLADALKLTWIATTIYPRPRLILCLSDPAAAAPFRPSTRSWGARALADLGITIELVELPDDVRAGIVAAQQRQHR